jgi:uncharacterized protein YlxW (UPF0749 family)
MAAMGVVTPSDKPQSGVPTRPDASMTLLTDLMTHSLDAGYADAAARRRTGQSTKTSRWVLLVGLAGVGLLLTISAVQTHSRASVVAQTRDALVSEIDARSSANDRLAASLDRRRSQVTQERQDILRLTDEGKVLARTLTTFEDSTGTGAVRGPALVVDVRDANEDGGSADVDPRAGEASNGRVTDRDLQTLVNEVWGAGAEAVSINGQRLTTLSAIRSAGDAVLVDFRPLSPPYEIIGIGDAPRLRTAFAEGFGGSYLQALRDYGITSSIATRDTVRLGASAGVTLRYATTPTRSENGS